MPTTAPADELLGDEAALVETDVVVDETVEADVAVDETVGALTEELALEIETTEVTGDEMLVTEDDGWDDLPSPPPPQATKQVRLLTNKMRIELDMVKTP